MQLGVSTHVFLPIRLHTGLLDAIARSGAAVVEVFAARHHFDYTDRAAVRDLASWFRDSGLVATLHQPLTSESPWSRHAAPDLNLIDPEKLRRIQAMDETKRALEAAEQIPFRSVTLHLGTKDERWTDRSLEDALTAVEHLQAFARPLGVQILLENLQNEVTSPEHLLAILRVGHFDEVGITLDVGHAHLTDYKNPGAGIDAAFELLKPRIVELHLHDNNGSRDEHLWPGAPTESGAPLSKGVDWANVHRQASSLTPETRGILEIEHSPADSAEAVTRRAEEFFSLERRRADALLQNPDALTSQNR
jgi:sugar phosphate isomerase/epimerase